MLRKAKEIEIKPITSAQGRAVIRTFHYSGKVVNNSQLHIGVFYEKELLGAMQFGPPMDKQKILPLVRDTPWNGMLELNRMAFSEKLPRNSESRAIAVALRMLKKHRPDIQWVVSFADAAQCGDGAIYRASGFALTQIKRNSTILKMPDGAVYADIALRPGCAARADVMRKYDIRDNGSRSNELFLRAGGVILPGFQMRYIYFLQPSARARLTCKILPFSAIDAAKARMYRGKRPGSIGADAPNIPDGRGRLAADPRAPQAQ